MPSWQEPREGGGMRVLLRFRARSGGEFPRRSCYTIGGVVVHNRVSHTPLVLRYILLYKKVCIGHY